MGVIINRPDHFKSRERIYLFESFSVVVESGYFNINQPDADGFIGVNWKSESGTKEPHSYLFKVITSIPLENVQLFDERKLSLAIARAIEVNLNPWLIEPIVVESVAMSDGFGYSLKVHDTRPDAMKECSV